MRKRRLLAGAMVVLGGCNGNPTSKIIVPPTSPTAPPSSTWTARGKVFQTSFDICRDCAVEMVDGARTGTSTLTDSNGNFSLDVPGESPQVTLRAMKEGYRSVDEQVVTRGGNSAWVALSVASVQPPARLGGAYRMTLTPDPIACTGLPPATRVREYDILLKGNARLPDFAFHAEPVGRVVERFDMYAGVSGDDVGISVWHPEDESAGIIERLNAATGESFSVFAWTAVPTRYGVPLTASLKGTLTWCPTMSAGASCVVCESSDHQLTFVPR